MLSEHKSLHNHVEIFLKKSEVNHEESDAWKVFTYFWQHSGFFFLRQASLFKNQKNLLKGIEMAKRIKYNVIYSS